MDSCACWPVHVAKPRMISCRAASVMLAMKPAHASDAQVVFVRGIWAPSSVLPHEDSSSLIFERAPPHVESGTSRRRLWPSSMTSEAGEALQASEQAIMLTIIARPDDARRLRKQGRGAAVTGWVCRVSYRRGFKSAEGALVQGTGLGLAACGWKLPWSVEHAPPPIESARPRAWFFTVLTSTLVIKSISTSKTNTFARRVR